MSSDHRADQVQAIRQQRLQNEYAGMQVKGQGYAGFSWAVSAGDPPDLYAFRYHEVHTATLTDQGPTVYTGPAEVIVSLQGGYPYEAPQFWVRTPSNIFNPNISSGQGPIPAGIICMGRHRLESSVASLIFRIHHMLVWKSVSLNEHNALNHEACIWGRSIDLPLDTRPLS